MKLVKTEWLSCGFQKSYNPCSNKLKICEISNCFNIICSFHTNQVNDLCLFKGCCKDKYHQEYSICKKCLESWVDLNEQRMRTM